MYVFATTPMSKFYVDSPEIESLLKTSIEPNRGEDAIDD